MGSATGLRDWPRRARAAGAISLLLILLVGCKEKQSEFDHLVQGSRVITQLGPLYLGQPVAEIEASFGRPRESSVLVEPSQFLPGGSVRIADGTVLTYALDRKGGVVVYIESRHRQSSVAGLAPGDTFRKLQTRFPDSKALVVTGYGTLFAIGSHAYAAFSTWERDIVGSDEIDWVEVRRDPWWSEKSASQ